MMTTASDCCTDLQLPVTLKSQSNFRPKDEFKVHAKRIVSDLEYVLGELKTVVVDMRKMADQIDLVTSRVDRYYGNTVDQLHCHGNVNKEDADIVEAKSRDAQTRSRTSTDKAIFSLSTRTRTRTADDELHVIPNLCGLLQSHRRQGNHFRCPSSRETAPKSREITEASHDVIQSEEGVVGPAATARSEELDSLSADVLGVEGSLSSSVRTDDGDRQSTACVCLCDTSSSSQDTGYCGLYEKELDERLELDATDLCLLTPEGRRQWTLSWYGASGHNSSESVRRDEMVTDELLLRNYSQEDEDYDDDADDSVSDDDDDYDDALNCEKTFPARIMISKMRNCRWRAIIEP